MRDALSRVFAAALLAGALALSAGPAGEDALVDKIENVGPVLAGGPTHLARVQTRTFHA